MSNQQPVRQLAAILEQLASEEHYLFSIADLHSALPDHTVGAFKALVSRAEKSGLLKRVCRGIYLFPRVKVLYGVLLFHTAARLRAGDFNYISLETALSDAGVISQIPINWISVMSSGRSNVIRCGKYGTIEFVHTAKSPAEIAEELVYDERCHLWRASVALALRDMRYTKRNTDLVDWSAIDESL